jgi:DNA-binding transcriptional regulator YbjK
MAFGAQRRETTSAEGRRREILVATLRVIASNGTDAVTHRRVAAEADVPLGSLTYYFESREDLIRESFRFYIDEANAFILGVEQEIPPTTAAGLVDAILELMRREFSQPEMLRAEYELILHAARDEEIARAFSAWERNLEARLAGALEPMGTVRPLQAARTLLHLVRGFELQSLANRAERADEFRNRLLGVVNALVGGTAPRAHALPTPRRRPKPASLQTQKRRTHR